MSITLHATATSGVEIDAEEYERSYFERLAAHDRRSFLASVIVAGTAALSLVTILGAVAR